MYTPSMQEASNVRRNFTLRDINVLKIVLCRYWPSSRHTMSHSSILYDSIPMHSGLYPQLSVADDCNSYRRDSEQVFHTKVNL